MYEIFVKLCEKYGVTAYKVGKETGIASSTFSDWKSGRSRPKADKMQKIADYFGVSVDYLMTGEEPAKKPNSDLTARDERDIAKDVNSIMEKLAAGEAGPASYDGMELDPEAAELFRDELEIALRRLKMINKEKYTPKKYKK
ncbi:Helix-turn-helix [[Clostridium] cf. saccharolyticum K10]|nr:Helix-turn-helix [[Clostridium] cf. saccharolyticum K10]